MTKYKILVLFLLVLSGTTVLSEDSLQYIWPTDASRVLTSSFAESRPGRFHAGIDIKTWGETGYEIYAVRDGYLSRIDVSPFGYGKALYLTLDTGEHVIYGHLEKFRKDIEDWVWDEQVKRGRYAVKLYPGRSRFQVKQGELLGYTGQTGIGYPHLHFEMRDASHHPINPHIHGYKVEDHSAPFITKVLIKPLDAFSNVQGDVKPQLFYPINTGSGMYSLRDTVRVHGYIAFAVSAFDQMEDYPHKFGTFINELMLDDSVLFRAAYEKFSYSSNHYFKLDRDYRQLLRGNGYFYNLYRDKNNILPFYGSVPEYTGVLNIRTEKMNGLFDSEENGILHTDQTHLFKIRVQDFWGNTATVSGVIAPAADSLYVVPSPPLDDLDTIETLIVNQTSADASAFPDSISLPPFSVEMDFFDAHVRLLLKQNTDRPYHPVVLGELPDGTIQNAPLIRSDSMWICAWPLTPDLQGPVSLQILARNYIGPDIIQNVSIPVHTVNPGEQKVLYYADRTCTLVFSPYSLFKTMHVRFDTSAADSSNGEIVGPIYHLEPRDVPMEKGAELRLHCPDSLDNRQQLAVYSRFRDHFSFIGNSFDPVSSTLSGHISGMGSYCIARDHEPPLIWGIRPANGDTLDIVTPVLSVFFKDEMSGVSGEENRQLILDGKPVIAVFDPENDRLSYRPRSPLEPGKHTFKVRIIDRCGNSSVQTVVFIIKEDL